MPSKIDLISLKAKLKLFRLAITATTSHSIAGKKLKEAKSSSSPAQVKDANPVVQDDKKEKKKAPRFECVTCGASYAQTASLYRHRVQKHLPRKKWSPRASSGRRKASTKYKNSASSNINTTTTRIIKKKSCSIHLDVKSKPAPSGPPLRRLSSRRRQAGRS